MHVTYFFRKPQEYYHSIEELFTVIQKHLPDHIHFSNYAVGRASKGVKQMLHNAREARKHQGEINHVTGDVHYISIFMSKKKTILTIHDLVPLKRGNPFKRHFIKLFWYDLPVRRVRFVTVISEFTKQELMKQLWISEKKIKVIPNTVSSAFQYKPKIFNQQKPCFLQVGTKPNKNLERVIPALEGLPSKLLILGKLGRQQKKLLKKHQIEYEDFYNIRYEEVIGLYARCDILLFVSTYEGFGLPVLEAQTTGRPVICSNAASLPEVAGGAAEIADPYSVEAIRKAIFNLTENPERRRQLIANGRENAERFRPEEIAKKYAALYEKIAR